MGNPEIHLGGLGHAHLPAGTGPDIDEFLLPVPDAARQAIAEKAAQIGPDRTGPANGDILVPPNDPVFFVQDYAHYTIFYRDGVGAREIHGAIRDKYRQLKGITRFGAPWTDEWTCPDEIGKYNHFDKDASIYWHPDTGPYALWGPIRQEWANRGWERGPLGYPVHDQITVPDSQGCLFQNGALGINNETGEVRDAPSARLDHDAVLTMVWRMFDAQGHPMPGIASVGEVLMDVFDPAGLLPIGHSGGETVGLYPQRSLDSVSGTGGAFDRARNRLIACTINGFHNMGIYPDQTWTVRIQLLLQDEPAPLGNGTNLVANHVANHVTAEGIGSGTLVDSLHGRLPAAFPVRFAGISDPNVPDIATEAQFLGLIVEPNGDVSLHFCDTLPGRLAALITQRKIEALLD